MKHSFMQHFVLLAILGSLFSVAQAQVPQLINYQALLTDPATGQPVADDTYEIIFSIYDVSTGGTAIWTETHNVTTKNGLYSASLGSTTPLTADILDGAEKYLGVKVGADPEMAPRKRIVSVAYAIVSGNADSLGGKAATEYATKTEISTSDGDPPNQGSNQVSWDNLKDVPAGFADGVDNTGSISGGWVDDGTVVRLETSSDNVGIGTNTPNGKLHVATNGLHAGYFTSNHPSSDAHVVHAEYTGTGENDATAVYGKSTPFDFYGIGGSFEGGMHGVVGMVSPGAGDNTYIGVKGKVSAGSISGTNQGLYGDVTGPGTNYGVFGNAAGTGSKESYGVYGTAFGPGANYGIRGRAHGTGSEESYGVYGEASGTGTGAKWAGYFDGDVHVAAALDVASTAQMTGFKLTTAPANGYVLTSDASGVGTWQPPPGAPDNDWTISGNDMYSAVSGNVGIGATNPTAKLHVQGIDGALFEGTFGSGTIPKEGAGTRMMWYPAKAAFRVGGVDASASNFWDADSIGDYSMAAGYATRARGDWSTAMGRFTEASGDASTAMGWFTKSSGGASMAMGNWSVASGFGATAMGVGSVASGHSSTAMGNSIAARGDESFAAGEFARANHKGCFVWGDATGTSADTVYSTGTNQFIVRAAGGTWFYSSSNLSAGVKLNPGAGSWSSVSDRTLKRNIRLVDGQEILSQLEQIPISRWSYKAQDPNIEHLGPMAQDFYAAFGVGEDDRHISTIDADGVALAAVQELHKLVKEQADEIAVLKKQIKELQQR